MKISFTKLFVFFNIPFFLTAGYSQSWVLQPDLSDEFNYPAGTSINLDKWHFQTDAHFNNEAQQYTDRQYNVPDGANQDDYNIRTTDTSIQIVARNNHGEYTSVRINSQCRMAFTYGRTEFRLKAPETEISGLWPAVWMLGNDINQSPTCPAAGSRGWPGCGEIDLWEYQSVYPDSYITNAFCSNSCENTSREDIYPGNQAGRWFIYCFEWNEDHMKYWYRNDGEAFDVVRGLKTKSTDGCDVICFQDDMFYLINLAVGGTLGGSIDCSFPQTLELDYIRTYKFDPDAAAVRPSSRNSITPAVDYSITGKGVFRLNIARSSHVSLRVYDLTGRLVKILVNNSLEPGSYEYPTDKSSLIAQKSGSGVFVVNGVIDGEVVNHKIMSY